MPHLRKSNAEGIRRDMSENANPNLTVTQIASSYDDPRFFPLEASGFPALENVYFITGAGSASASELVVSGLVTKNPNGDFIPDLATSWEILDQGVSRTHLWTEYCHAMAARTSPCCQPGCRRILHDLYHHLRLSGRSPRTAGDLHQDCRQHLVDFG